MSRAHKPVAGSWIRTFVLMVYPLTALLFKVRWRRLERIPPQGPVLVAVNHISQADTIATARMIWESGRIPRFLIKSTVFDVPVLGALLRNAGQIPVHRGGRDAIHSLQSAIQALERGECVIIYPEGTITQDPDYWPMTAKTGVARLALACPDVPVVPVGQWGAHLTLGRGAKLRLLPRHLHQASVGEPVDLSRFRQGPADNDTLRAVTAEIMRSITAEVATLRDGQPPQEPLPWTPSPHLRKTSRRTGQAAEGAVTHDADPSTT